MKWKRRTVATEERYFIASQWVLMWRKFRKHKLAMVGTAVLACFYLIAIFCEFFAVVDPFKRHKYVFAPPQRIRFFDEEGKFHLRPFVYGLNRTIDTETLERIFTVDKNRQYPISLFVRGDSYKLWGLFEMDLHFIGVKGEGASLFLLGTERIGRDLFSRLMYATRISVSIGMLGVAITFIVGSVVGGISGYFGGVVDTFIQRVIEFLMSIPTIPLWLALSASVPREWPALRVYFFITIILSIFGWTALARVTRGRLISVREEDFVMAAVIAGATHRSIITRHLLPSFLSYLIVNLTLSIPGMILGETALSFLGLGLRPPVVSWGVLLKDAQDVRVIAMYPWLLIPSLFVIVYVISFNFLGDGLRDAADPYR
jgi:peptide/nickel transport system permease protein